TSAKRLSWQLLLFDMLLSSVEVGLINAGFTGMMALQSLVEPRIALVAARSDPELASSASDRREVRSDREPHKPRGRIRPCSPEPCPSVGSPCPPRRRTPWGWHRRRDR